jgi:putative transposase
MSKSNPFRYFRTSREVIRLAVMMYVRFPLSLRDVEDLLHERGIDVSHESVRFWWNRFGPLFASEIRKARIQRMRSYSNWQWHLDEVFVKINGKTHYMWRAVDHEGEVLDAFFHKASRPQGSIEILQEIDEALRSNRKDRHRQAALLRRRDEGNRERGPAVHRTLAEQPSREFTPAIPTTRTRDVPLPAHAKFADIRRRPRLDPQPLQHGTQSLL